MLRIKKYRITSSKQIGAILETYFKHTYGALAYCGWKVLQDNVLSPSDLFVSCSLSGRPNPFDRAYFTLFNEGKKIEIEKFLAKIPKKSDIEYSDMSLNGLGKVIEQLFEATVQVPGIQLPIATKILHKKRPNLIPILDRYVVKKYWGAEYNQFYPITLRGKREDSTLNLFDQIKEDISRNRSILSEGANYFSEKNSEVGNDIFEALTPLRTLDIIIWCGMYNSRKYFRCLRNNKI